MSRIVRMVGDKYPHQLSHLTSPQPQVCRQMAAVIDFGTLLIPALSEYKDAKDRASENRTVSPVSRKGLLSQHRGRKTSPSLDQLRWHLNQTGEGSLDTPPLSSPFQCLCEKGTENRREMCTSEKLSWWGWDPGLHACYAGTLPLSYDISRWCVLMPELLKG